MLSLYCRRINSAAYCLTSFLVTPAEQASVRQLVPTKQLPTALSQNEARQHAASLIGPPLAGALFAIDGALPFAIDAVTYLVSALAILAINHPLSAPRRLGGPSTLAADMVEGVTFLLSRAYFRAFVVFTCLLDFASSALYLAVIVSLTRWGVQATVIGAVIGVLLDGVLTGSGQPCQKQPSMNTATRRFVKTRSAVRRSDGSGRTPTR